MSATELQEDEREALASIYEGDESFKEVDPCTYQYKYGENDNAKSFLLELKWGSDYPNESPEVNMETFYNRHLAASLKNKISSLIKKESEEYLGMSMTYSLFESVKEKFEELMEEQPDEPEKLEVEKLCITEPEPEPQEGLKKEKKIQLTKAQKRRQWNRTDGKGEKPRGWNWVDIVKHLSQTGPKEDNLPIS